MRPYANLGGNSGVLAYATTFDSITVQFKDGAEYLYTNASAGSAAISDMKARADGGIGLNSYINQYVRKRYARRLR